MGPEATQAAPRSSRQSVVVAVLRIVTHTSTPPHIALFPRPSIHIHLWVKAEREQPPPNGRRQREPAGRSPARSAGKAERSDRRAREDYGWGWAGRFNQTNPRSPPKTRPPNTRGSASPKGEARREGAGKAEQSECRAREDYGWGWAGRFNQTKPRSPPKTRPPNTRGSASPKGEARREGAGKAERSECRAREDYGWGWAGGVTKPDQAPRPSTTPHHIRGSLSASASASVSVSVQCQRQRQRQRQRQCQRQRQ